MSRSRSQSILEYIILLSVVVLAVGAMKLYLTRSVKAQFKVIQDQLNDQYKYKDKLKTDATARKPGG
jgi:uncharacterized protein (UPF0333 family)